MSKDKASVSKSPNEQMSGMGSRNISHQPDSDAEKKRIRMTIYVWRMNFLGVDCDPNSDVNPESSL